MFRGVFPSLFPATHHDFPTVAEIFLRAFFVRIFIHDFSFGNWFALDSGGS
jgi:hypothetical protein